MLEPIPLVSGQAAIDPGQVTVIKSFLMLFNDPQMLPQSVLLYVKGLLDIDLTDPALLQCGNAFSNVDRHLLRFTQE